MLFACWRAWAWNTSDSIPLIQTLASRERIPMTPKRLRLIARIIKEGVPANSTSTLAIADELETHALEYENLRQQFQELAARKSSEKEIRIKEPLDAVSKQSIPVLPKASEGML
jgi:hypothetical protein